MSDLKQYKCPSCSGDLVFNIELQKMNCAFCKADFEAEEVKELAKFIGKDKFDRSCFEDSQIDKWREDELKGKKLYKCESCGGEIICDEIEASTSCPYCDSKVVMTGQFLGGDKPDIIIPFKIDKKKAVKIYTDRVKGEGKFVSRSFTDEHKISEIKGVYVPFWLFDAKTTGQVKYKAQKVRRWSTSSYDYVEKSYYLLFREGSAEFENVPVDASSKLDDVMMQSVEPFNLDEAVDFDTMYLSGYMANKYDVTKDEVIKTAHDRFKVSMAEVLADRANKMYDEVDTLESYIQVEDGTSKYAFYPVWILNINWRDKSYQYVINGQTGKLACEFPLDRFNFFKWCLLYWAGASAIVYVITYIIMFLL